MSASTCQSYSTNIGLLDAMVEGRLYDDYLPAIFKLYLKVAVAGKTAGNWHEFGVGVSING